MQDASAFRIHFLMHPERLL